MRCAHNLTIKTGLPVHSMLLNVMVSGVPFLAKATGSFLEYGSRPARPNVMGIQDW